MRGILGRSGKFVVGALFGGAWVGVCESAYGGASLLYGALLYAALWALGGAGLAIVLSLVMRYGLLFRPLFTWGCATACTTSALVLVRFIVLRDALGEASGAGPTALAIAACAALIVGVIILVAGGRVERAFEDRHPHGAILWAIPVATVLLFAIVAQMGSDDIDETLPKAPRTYAGGGVILIVVDTLRADVLGAYGAKNHRGLLPSPNFDDLADRGLLFADTSAQASWTRPAMASMLTSRHPSGHHTTTKTSMLPQDLETLAEVLQRADVYTGAVVTNYNLEEAFGFHQGFDYFQYLAPARYLGGPKRAIRLAAYNVYRLVRERFLRGARQPDHFYRSGDAVNAAAIRLLDRIGDHNFFLWLHYMEPHDPYFATDGNSWARVSDPNPAPEQAGAMLDAYRDEVQRWDRMLGDLQKALQARGLADTTTLIVTSDHGEEFHEHGGFYHGTTLYEEQLALPLVVAGKDVTPGVDVSLVRQIDIAPTVAGLFGVEAPSAWEGRNLLDDTVAPTGTLAEEDHEGNVLTAYRSNGAEGRLKLIKANANNPRGLPTTEVFDLDTDPREKRSLDLSAGTAEVLQAMMGAAQRQAERGGVLPVNRQLDTDAQEALRSLGYVR